MLLAVHGSVGNASDPNLRMLVRRDGRPTAAGVSIVIFKRSARLDQSMCSFVGFRCDFQGPLKVVNGNFPTTDPVTA